MSPVDYSSSSQLFAFEEKGIAVLIHQSRDYLSFRISCMYVVTIKVAVIFNKKH